MIRHVEAKGWDKVEHYFRHQSDCSKLYDVKGVPHVMIIDKAGKIAFKGHPANRPDLAADLTNLLAGEKLVGEGTATASSVAGTTCRDVVDELKNPAPVGFTEVDSAAIS